MKYLIDSNCFIEPHRGLCPLDVAVSFWNKLKELMTEKDVYVLDKVKGELTEWEDELKKWIVDNVGKDQLVKFETAESVAKFKEVNMWALSNVQYTQGAKDKFTNADRADIYLVTYAALNPYEWTVVSQEKSAPLSKTEIKLPDACAKFNVRCIHFMEMFREMKETF